MTFLWLILYNAFALPILYTGLRIFALFNRKAKRGFEGRQGVWEYLRHAPALKQKDKKRIWIHSASLGEFEQAKPIIESLRSSNDLCYIVTFFSPSGYDNAKKYPHADVISYIPFDTPHAAREFVSLINPDIAIIMRYDLWPNHINVLHKKNIPIFLIDATLRSDSLRLKPVIRVFHHELYSRLHKILAVSQTDKDNFLNLRLSPARVDVVGDTRFDRVLQNSLAAKQKKILRDEVTGERNVLVAGSTWEEDEEVLFPVIMKLLKYRNNFAAIIVPHEPTVPHIEKIENEFSEAGIATIRFSLLNDYHAERVIIVDSIGILLTLYYYAKIAFVGGSFKSNVHNVLEAAIYGIPVMYGPKIHGSAEARALAESGGGTIVRDKIGCYRQLNSLLLSDKTRLAKGNISYQYTMSNTGATQKILQFLEPHIRDE
jgi:3-deoxy-D-manno-octulosonic-acid transferase